MAAPENPSAAPGPLPEYRLNLTEPLDRARQMEARGDLESARELARSFFEELSREIGGRAAWVPNAAGAARCAVRCWVKRGEAEEARRFLAGARERLDPSTPGGLRLRARLEEEEARLLEFQGALAEFRSRAEEFRSHPRPGLQSHALVLGLAARRATRAWGEMAASDLGAQLIEEIAEGLWRAPSTDLRPLAAALELLADEAARSGGPDRAARILERAQARVDAALALFRALSVLSAAPCHPGPRARLLRLRAAHHRRAGEPERARALLEELSRVLPGEGAVEWLLLGDARAALADLEASAPAPEEAAFREELRARLLRLLGREPEARQAAREGLALHQPGERPPLQDEWYQRWLHRLHRFAGEHRRLRLAEAAGEAVRAGFESLAAEVARAALELHAMEAAVAAELEGHILLRAGRREAAFHCLHRAMEAYAGEEWEESEHVYEEDFLALDGLGREEAVLRSIDPGWRDPAERVETLMRGLFTPDEFRAFGDHAVEDYFATLRPGPLDRDPEEVVAEMKLKGTRI